MAVRDRDSSIPRQESREVAPGLELTAVGGPGEPALPERVPNWIVRALEATIGVREVTVQR